MPRTETSRRSCVGALTTTLTRAPFAHMFLIFKYLWMSSRWE
jgi:hypothetical protein